MKVQLNLGRKKWSTTPAFPGRCRLPINLCRGISPKIACPSRLPRSWPAPIFAHARTFTSTNAVTMPAPEKFISFIDQHADDFIQRLKEAVAIPRCVEPLKSRADYSELPLTFSVSGDPKHRPDVFKMGSWLQSQLESLGVQTKQVDLGKHNMDGHELQLPPAIFGRIGDDPKKKTILIYGHYDVQPVSLHADERVKRPRDRPLT